MSETRAQIHRAIQAAPGVHFSALATGLGLAHGQLQYHLHRLSRDGRIRRERRYGRTHYFPPDYDDVEREILALLRRETPRDVMVVLLHRGESRPGDVAERLGLARSTLEWQLDRLIEAGLVEKRRDEQGGVHLRARREALVTDLLADLTPTLATTLSDRFARLVDNLLDS